MVIVEVSILFGWLALAVRAALAPSAMAAAVLVVMNVLRFIELRIIIILPFLLLVWRSGTEKLQIDTSTSPTIA
jgi:hypothetical protein